MIDTTNPVGRLYQMRIGSPVQLDEISGLGQKIKAGIGQHGKIVVAGDLRGCTVFPPDIYDAFVKLIRSDNPGIVRSALLLPQSATFTLQLERMVREAGNPNRRTFTDHAAWREWLAEVLGQAEQDAIVRFLG